MARRPARESGKSYWHTAVSTVCIAVGVGIYLLKPTMVLTIFTSKDVNEARGGLILAVGRVRSKKKKNEKKTRKNPPHPKHTTKSAAARQPRPPRDGARKKHVPRISPYLPASIDPGFVEIGLVQLSQSVKKTNVTHTHNGTLYAPRYEEASLPIGKKRPH